MPMSDGAILKTFNVRKDVLYMLLHILFVIIANYLCPYVIVRTCY